MVRYSTYIVEPGQCLQDVALLLFGSIDGVANILGSNPNLSYAALYPGQPLNYVPEQLNAQVAQSYLGSGYAPATSSQMSDAPVPPVAPAANQVIIHTFELPDMVIDAPAEVTIPPSVVLDHDGNEIESLSPGEEYTVERATVTGANGFYGAFVEAGDTLTLPLAEVRLSDTSVVAELDPGETYDVPDAILEGTLGVYSSTALPGETKIIPQVRIYNSVGNLIGQGDAGESVTVPDVNVSRDGIAFASAPAGTTINVPSNCPAPDGIAYQRIQPFSQQTSYRVGDIAWHVNNGTFDFTHPTNPSQIQSLDRLDPDNHWRLKYNNAFGNKYRFTNSIGNPSTSGKLGFTSGNFAGALNWYVIDHLTGVAIYTANLGNFNSNWNGAIDAVHAQRSANFYGYNNWFPLTIEHYLSMGEDNPSGADFTGLLNGGVVSGFTATFSWLANTDGSLATNTYITWSARRISLQPKTSGSTITIYMCRHHF
jgi:hypothetical protein